MHTYRVKIIQWIMVVAAIVATGSIHAQEADNEFIIDTKILTRGEVRSGGFTADSTDSKKLACFVKGQYRINFTYKRSWLEIKISPQMAGIWGQSIGLSLAEAWALMKSKHGLFLKIGRQGIEYDDERILGYDDWAMTAPTHDMLKLGYEGHGHKIHALLAYNQTSDNVAAGNTFYSGGIQPYKTMQALWYHYDTPKSLFGLSLIGLNIGIQNDKPSDPKTFFQQLVGTYMIFKPKFVSVEGAFYYQMGKEEHGIPISAFMGSAKLKAEPNEIYSLRLGYDYLSGDKYFALRPEGAFGLVFHDKIRGFCSVFGSHHQFYGAMDFFYMSSYVDNFTPGLQNLYAGGTVNPIKGLSINADYHFFAIATNLDYLKSPLGHEVEVSASYTFAKFVKVAAGYSFMKGTETMQQLQHLTENRQLHWGWVMLNISPTLFKTSWLDKKNRVAKQVAEQAVNE